MTLEDVKSMIYDITAEFFCGATVIWAEQINTKPETPYITLKLGGIRKTLFPLVNGDERAYSCSTTLEVNLYTKGKAITVAERVTGNYINTATSDLFDYFSFIESDVIVDRLATYGLDITLEPPIRDLTALQNDSKYRYRAMAEAIVSFIQNANGPYGVGGRTLPNASGGGTVEISNTITDIIEEADIKEKNYEGGN